MPVRRLFVVLAVLALVGLWQPATQATDGYFSHGYGTIAKGMAGAGVALPVGGLSPATNPAVLVLVEPGLDIGLAVFSPDRTYEIKGQPSGYPGTFGLAPGTVTSGKQVFPIPHAGLVRAKSRGAFGLSIFGNGGMNTSYDVPTFGAGPAGVDLEQLFVAPTYAVKLGARQAFGVTGIVAYQRFSAQGLRAFAPFSSDAARLTDMGYDHSYGGGLRIGYLGEISSHLSVGASYQSRIWMSRFEKYRGLFAGSGSFDVPANWVVGVAVKPTTDVDVAFDVQQVRYSTIPAVGNHLLPNLMQSALGTETGAGFGWDDMTTAKIGVQLRRGGGWTFRGGYSYGREPIPRSQVLFNILAPAVPEQHATFGLTRQLAGGRALHVAVTRAFQKAISGPNPLEAPGAQSISLKMQQWEAEAGLRIGF